MDTPMWSRVVPLVLAFASFAMACASCVSYYWIQDLTWHTNLNPLKRAGDYFYYLTTLGPWIACFKESVLGVGTCTAVTWTCGAIPCWYREDGVRVCGGIVALESISNCQLFNAVRILVVIGAFIVGCAVVLHFTWLCNDSMKFPLSAGPVGLIGSMTLMTAFIIFHIVLLPESGYDQIGGTVGWGYYMLVASFGPGLLAGFWTLGSAIYQKTVKNWSYDDENKVFWRREKFADEEARFGQEVEGDDPYGDEMEDYGTEDNYGEEADSGRY